MLKFPRSKSKKKTFFFFVLFLILASCFTFTLAQDNIKLDIYKKWSYGRTSNLLGILDLNADGLNEILINSPDENSLVCLNYAGEKIWNYPVLRNPTIIYGNLSMDICNEIVVVSSISYPIQSTLISCLNYKGELLWEQSVDFDILEPLEILDFDNDGQMEVVLIGEETVYSYDETGTIKYLTELGSEIIQEIYYYLKRELPLVIDYLKDGMYEILFRIDDSFLCYNLTGYLFWNYTIVEPGSEARRARSAPIAADFNRDGEIEIFCLYLDSIYAHDAVRILQLNTSGSEILRQEIILGHFFSEITSFGDVNFDGILDFVIVEDFGGLHCVSVNGDLLWSSEVIIDWCCTSTDILIVDLFGDNKTDIVANALYADEGITILDSDGNILAKELYPNNEWNIRACMDFDLDNNNDLLIEYGSVCCYGVSTDKTKSIERGYEFSSIIHNYHYLDQDFDYLDDFRETIYGCNITDSDTDNDIFLDGWEKQVGLNPLVDERNLDLDNDGLTNYEEIYEYHTSIFLPDTDGDGVLDIDDKNEIKPLGKAGFEIFSIVVVSSIIVVLVINRSRKKNQEVLEK